MKDSSIRELVILGLGIALVAIATMIIQIPVPATSGYIHLGDGVILLIAASFGKKHGFICASVGSALADILSGYTMWAPFTFVIKGIMGLAMAYISGADFADFKFISKKSVLASLVSSVIMVVGYFLAKFMMTSTVEAALLGIPWNLVQAGAGLLVYLLVGKLFENINIRKLVNI